MRYWACPRGSISKAGFFTNRMPPRYSKRDCGKILDLRCYSIGTNANPYQPIEREYKLTRRILEILEMHNHLFSMATKASLIARDIDIIGPIAEKKLAQAYVAVTTLDRDMSRKMEPLAPTPQRQLDVI